MIPISNTFNKTSVRNLVEQLQIGYVYINSFGNIVSGIYGYMQQYIDQTFIEYCLKSNMLSAFHSTRPISEV